LSLTTEALAKSVGYQFKDPRLLDIAVTHRSAGSGNNERLEFLGDAVLGQVVAEWLYRSFPEGDEGQLSRLRASLVKREALADIARGLALGDFLRLGSGELKSGGFRRGSILADALEAVFGAVLVDGGFEACRDCIHRLYAQRFENISVVDELKDPKTRLQEYLQSRKLALPEYDMVRVTGKAHNQLFDVECRVIALDLVCVGQGSSRRKAEQAAAVRMLEQFNVST
jgi:ribonuclease-3